MVEGEADLDEVRRRLSYDARVAYAVLFGSGARGTAHGGSDLDIALGLTPGTRLDVRAFGALASTLEAAAGRPVDLVLLEEAGPALAYRVFRDGRVLVERDRSALVDRKARAVLEYLDFRPVEEICARGVLAAATRGR